MKKSSKNILTLLIIITMTCGGIVIGLNWDKIFNKQLTNSNLDENAEEWTGNKDTYTGVKNTDTIDIPGYDVINLKSNTKDQKVNFYNPKQNNCYFKISLILSDVSKLWESKLIEPGSAIYNISLDKSLTANEYKNSTLKYECFTLDNNQSPLNGSEIKLTLNVIE